MQKQTIKYDSPLDALIAVTKRLSIFEGKYRMSTEDFFDKFSQGQMDDSIDFIEWSNDYQHYLALRFEVEKQIQQSFFIFGAGSVSFLFVSQGFDGVQFGRSVGRIRAESNPHHDAQHKNKAGTVPHDASLTRKRMKLIKSFCGCFTTPGGRFSRKKPPWPPKARVMMNPGWCYRKSAQRCSNLKGEIGPSGRSILFSRQLMPLFCHSPFRIKEGKE